MGNRITTLLQLRLKSQDLAAPQGLWRRCFFSARGSSDKQKFSNSSILQITLFSCS